MIQQVFGSESLILRQNKCFKCGREQKKVHAGRPTTSRYEDNVQLMCDVLHSYRRLSVQMITDHVGSDKMTVYTIITKYLQMREICAKFISKVRKKRGQRLPGLERHGNVFSTSFKFRFGPSGLFPVLRVCTAIKGHRHKTVAEVQETPIHCLKDIPEKDVQGPIQEWNTR